ncbi:putative transcription elongation factor [Klebsormidium nitens]|uniref:Putative transcription elongation factor n=1 Tax=Klebsormidium nitens TaxID=105231 RepID=A0A1Y1I568_KLENI|nr:putative transcription elongation factor [Klebsormidium nitens]|eukprot:GAQ85102.1 putative transcription elongation factor [Klebsormidium nitens]
MEDPYAVLSRILESPLKRPFQITVESTYASTLTVTADDGGYMVEHSNRALPVRRWQTVPETVRAVVDSMSVGRIRKLTLKPKGNIRTTYALFDATGGKTHEVANILAGLTPRNIRARDRGAAAAPVPVPARRGFKAPDPDESPPSMPPSRLAPPRGAVRAAAPSGAAVARGVFGPPNPSRGPFRGAVQPVVPRRVPVVRSAAPIGVPAVLRPEDNMLVDDRRNEVISFEASASGAIFVKRLFDRTRRTSKEVVLKIYPRRRGGMTAADASGGSTEYFLYGYCNKMLDLGITAGIMRMVEAPHLSHLSTNQQLVGKEQHVVQLVRRYTAKKGIQKGIRPDEVRGRGSFATEYVDGMLLADLFTRDSLTEPQLWCVFIDVLYTIECLVRVGILHLDLHLNNVMLVATSDIGHKSYEYTDRTGRKTVFYLPSFGYDVKVYDFDRGVKHEPRPFGASVRAEFKGVVANGLLTEDAYDRQVRWPYTNPDNPNRYDVDAFKFANTLTAALSTKPYSAPGLLRFLNTAYKSPFVAGFRQNTDADGFGFPSVVITDTYPTSDQLFDGIFKTKPDLLRPVPGASRSVSMQSLYTDIGTIEATRQEAQRRAQEETKAEEAQRRAQEAAKAEAARQEAKMRAQEAARAEAARQEAQTRALEEAKAEAARQEAKMRAQEAARAEAARQEAQTRAEEEAKAEDARQEAQRRVEEEGEGAEDDTQRPDTTAAEKAAAMRDAARREVDELWAQAELKRAKSKQTTGRVAEPVREEATTVRPIPLQSHEDVARGKALEIERWLKEEYGKNLERGVESASAFLISDAERRASAKRVEIGRKGERRVGFSPIDDVRTLPPKSPLEGSEQGDRGDGDPDGGEGRTEEGPLGRGLDALKREVMERLAALKRSFEETSWDERETSLPERPDTGNSEASGRAWIVEEAKRRLEAIGDRRPAEMRLISKSLERVSRGHEGVRSSVVATGPGNERGAVFRTDGDIESAAVRFVKEQDGHVFVLCDQGDLDSLRSYPGCTIVSGIDGLPPWVWTHGNILFVGSNRAFDAVLRRLREIPGVERAKVSIILGSEEARSMSPEDAERLYDLSAGGRRSENIGTRDVDSKTLTEFWEALTKVVDAASTRLRTVGGLSRELQKMKVRLHRDASVRGKQVVLDDLFKNFVALKSAVCATTDPLIFVRDADGNVTAQSWKPDARRARPSPREVSVIHPNIWKDYREYEKPGPTPPVDPGRVPEDDEGAMEDEVPLRRPPRKRRGDTSPGPSEGRHPVPEDKDEEPEEPEPTRRATRGDAGEELETNDESRTGSLDSADEPSREGNYERLASDDDDSSESESDEKRPRTVVTGPGRERGGLIRCLGDMAAAAILYASAQQNVVFFVTDIPARDFEAFDHSDCVFRVISPGKAATELPDWAWVSGNILFTGPKSMTYAVRKKLLATKLLSPPLYPKVSFLLCGPDADDQGLRVDLNAVI